MIYSKLFDWQKKIIDKFKNRSSFGLFLDMGLGKTPLSLAFAEQNNCTKVIIITVNAKVMEPESIEGSWLSWAKQSNISYNFKVKNNAGFQIASNDLLLINYEALFCRSKNRTSNVTLKDNIKEFINSCKNHNVALIIDESHKMKDIHSMQTMSINKIQKELSLKSNKLYTYLLTGTPFTTAYIDLYSQLKTLGYPETKGTFIDEFCIKGCLPGLLGWQQPIVGYKNIDKLFDVIHQYAITINSSDVIDLPEQIFINHDLSVSKDFEMFTKERVQSKVLNDYLFFNRKCPPIFPDGKVVNNPFYRDIAYDTTKEFGSSEWLAESTGTFWLRARQLSIGFNGNAEKSIWYDRRRLDALKDFLTENEDNYLLFYNYTPELIELFDVCNQIGYNIDVYCGEIKNLTFYEKYSMQSEAERLTNHKNIILANFASGSTGLNWQLYNKCIIFSVPLYKDYAQGIKRIHRTGQKKTVFYHMFFQNNWLDKSMLKALQQQIDYSVDMFNSDIDRVKNIMDNINT